MQRDVQGVLEGWLGGGRSGLRLTCILVFNYDYGGMGALTTWMNRGTSLFWFGG